jgi:hypothetical protein
MADGKVAPGTHDFLGVAVNVIAVDRLRDALVAAPAGGFGHLEIERSDADVVGIFASREVERVKKSVAGFHRVLADQVVWRMAVIAGGGRPMAGLDPRIILRAHGMAVRAGSGIVQQVRVSFA